MKAVIFDLDGTLVDSAGDLQAAANRLMRQNGLPELDLATVTCFIGDGIARLVERCFAHSGALPDNLPAQIARFQAYYADEGHRRTRFMPGAEVALRRLAAGGLTLGLCTNKDAEPARAILRRLRVEGLFRAVVSGDSGLAKKPDAAPLLACVALCNAPQAGAVPGGAVYVGDSETDAATAAAAGLPFLLYTEGYRRGQLGTMQNAAAFRDFATLPKLVASQPQPRPAAEAG
jgi:phosphoglycolate phosphatase